MMGVRGNYVRRLGTRKRPEVQAGLLKPGLWQDLPCFIVGGGPSLKDFDFDLLTGHLVIGVNKAETLPQVSLAYSMDSQYMNWAQGGRLGAEVSAAEAAPLVHAWGGAEPTKRSGLRPFDAWFELADAADGLVWEWNGHLGHGENSGFGALNLALLLGADPIYLLGYDLGGGHWHDGYPMPSDPPWDRWCGHYAAAASRIQEHGALVVNCSPESRLTCFPKAGLDQLPFRRVRPLVVNYYTPDTGYEAQAREMAASARLFGLETCVSPMFDAGGWQANTYRKAAFLEAQLRRHDRPILWLDADARVRAYPHYVDQFMDTDADIAVCMIDWSRYPRIRRNDVELDSATMLLRPTPATYALLRRWQERNARMQATGQFEQRNLQEVLEEMGDAIRVARMPEPYCQIFDLMAGHGAPVIEQLQASRTLKREVGA